MGRYLSTSKHWSQAETDWLKANYATVDAKQGAQHCQTDPHTYRVKANKLGLKRPVRPKRHVNMDMFLAVTLPEVAYLLGLMWADGHLQLMELKTKSFYKASLGAVLENMREVEWIIDKVGEFGKMVYTPKTNSPSKRQQLHYWSYDQAFGRFLDQHDYRQKSKVAPTKVLGHIPVALHGYFWHGFLDGDGCIHHNAKHYQWALSFCGAYDQDWSALVSFLNGLGVKAAARKVVTKSRRKDGSFCRFSDVLIQNKAGVAKVLAATMQDRSIGFSRKRAVFDRLMANP